MKEMFAIPGYEGPKTEEEALASITGIIKRSGLAMKVHQCIDFFAVYTMKLGQLPSMDSVGEALSNENHPLHDEAKMACHFSVVTGMTLGLSAFLDHIRKEITNSPKNLDAAVALAQLLINMKGEIDSDGKCDCPKCKAKREAEANEEKCDCGADGDESERKPRWTCN